MKKLGVYVPIILRLKERGMTYREILAELQQQVPGDTELQNANVKQIANVVNDIKTSNDDGSTTLAKVLTSSNRELVKPFLDVMSAGNPKSVIRAQMNKLVSMEFSGMNDVEIERGLEIGRGDVAEFRGDHPDDYREARISHIASVMDSYRTETFKAHEMLAALARPAVKRLRELIESPQTPPPVLRQCIKDALDLTVGRTAPKTDPTEDMVSLGPEFKEATAAAEKALRLVKENSRDKAEEVSN